MTRSRPDSARSVRRHRNTRRCRAFPTAIQCCSYVVEVARRGERPARQERPLQRRTPLSQ